MTPRDRFLTAICHGVPDRVPAAPDFSNSIPCKRTGLPFWDIYFHHHIPLWQAYLDAADYFGVEAWMASCTGAPLKREHDRVEFQTEYEYRPEMDAMLQKTRIRTPDGDLTQTATCFRRDPPTLTEKPIKDLATDFKKYQWLLEPPTAVERDAVEEMRAACIKRQQAFGVSMGYPGFQIWSCWTEGGIEPLAFAEVDAPAILEKWFALEMERGTQELKLILSFKPDYILFGGSGTITLASPDLARKYALPALKLWSRMAQDAGVPTMLHSCGKSRILVDMLCEGTDINSINPLEMPPMGDVDLAEVKAARGARISLMGNLHTTKTMLQGSAAAVHAASIQAMRAAGRGGGFILSTGDQCGRDTPDENIFALVAAAREFGVYDPATGELPRLECATAGAR